MKPLIKVIGALCIAVLTLAAVPAVTELDNRVICSTALMPDRSAWDKDPNFSSYVTEAARRGLTVDACRQLIGASSASNPPASAVRTTSSPPAATGRGWIIIVFLATAVGVIWGVTNFFKRKAQARVLDAICKAMNPIAAEFPFFFVSYNVHSKTKATATALCMDRDGERLRFLEFNYFDGRKTVDLIVPISSVVSVELAGGNEVLNDYETTSTKPNALAGAVLGGLLFGRTGAIVGATAAGSEETTVATRRVVDKPSVLVFELDDLNNPVVRFSSTDHAQCDLWLHRVRSAIARHAKAAAALSAASKVSSSWPPRLPSGSDIATPSPPASYG
jgi:hypothetical protein